MFFLLFFSPYFFFVGSRKRKQIERNLFVPYDSAYCLSGVADILQTIITYALSFANVIKYEIGTCLVLISVFQKVNQRENFISLFKSN